jgi:hypothetical protein
LRLDVQKYFSLSRISSIVLVLTWMNIHNVLTWRERPLVLWISPYSERMSTVDSEDQSFLKEDAQ